MGYDSESLKIIAYKNKNGVLFKKICDNKDKIDNICREYYKTELKLEEN